jgi:hypothetical protein
VLRKIGQDSNLYTVIPVTCKGRVRTWSKKAPPERGLKVFQQVLSTSDGKGDATIQTIDVFKIDENSEGLS